MSIQFSEITLKYQKTYINIAKIVCFTLNIFLIENNFWLNQSKNKSLFKQQTPIFAIYNYVILKISSGFECISFFILF